jgi:hypothetical protein
MTIAAAFIICIEIVAIKDDPIILFGARAKVLTRVEYGLLGEVECLIGISSLD